MADETLSSFCREFQKEFQELDHMPSQKFDKASLVERRPLDGLLLCPGKVDGKALSLEGDGISEVQELLKVEVDVPLRVSYGADEKFPIGQEAFVYEVDVVSLSCVLDEPLEELDLVIRCL